VQAGFTVAFSIGVGKVEPVALGGAGGAGTKQPDRQFATCELHNIMHNIVRAARDRRSSHKDWDCKATHNFLLSATAFAQPGS
jgi:hypothetical protein